MKFRLYFLVLAVGLISCEGESDLVEADGFFESGNYVEAAEVYTKYISLHPGNTKAHYNRGRAYEELGDTEKALKDFRQVISIDEFHTQANISIAMDYYFRLQDYPNAIEYLDNALTGEKKSSKAFTLRGKSYQKLGDVTNASRDYNNAISTDSEYADAYYARGSLKVFLNKSADACTDFRIALSLGLEAAQSAVDKYCE